MPLQSQEEVQSLNSEAALINTSNDDSVVDKNASVDQVAEHLPSEMEHQEMEIEANASSNPESVSAAAVLQMFHQLKVNSLRRLAI